MWSRKVYIQIIRQLRFQLAEGFHDFDVSSSSDFVLVSYLLYRVINVNASRTTLPSYKMNEPEDFLSDALEILYDYTPITQSTAGSTFTYIITHTHPSIVNRDNPANSHCASSTITLKTPETQAANWSLHASSIWTSSLYLADHLDDLQIDSRIQDVDVRGDIHNPLCILELGAGAGLPSIAISKRFGHNVKVTASDYPDDALIQTLKGNIDSNGVSKFCSAIAHAWGTSVSPLLSQTYLANEITGPGFDLIIAADTLWNPDLHVLFLQTLQSTLRKKTSARVWIIAGLHTGRYTLQSFMNQLPSFGFEVETIEEREVKGRRRKEWSVESSAGDDEKERRNWVVCMNIKWSKV